MLEGLMLRVRILLYALAASLRASLYFSGTSGSTLRNMHRSGFLMVVSCTSWS